MATSDIFYFHDAATSVTGTLPGSTTIGGTASSVSVTGAGTNRSMNSTISVTAQVSQSWTTLANTSAQPTLIRRFLSEPLGVNTFGTGDLSFMYLGCGRLHSSTNSNFGATVQVWLWRPSTGATVATLVSSLASDTGSHSGSTAELWGGAVYGVGSATSADGDVIVCELWRSSRVQGMGTAYTNTAYYDGTTVTSLTSTGTAASNAASLIYFYVTAGTPGLVQMSSGAAANPPYTNPYPSLLAQ